MFLYSRYFLAWFICFVCCSCYALAQRQLQGQITDVQHKGIADVLLRLRDSVRILSGTYTDSNGYFLLSLSPGSEQLLISATGYQDRVIVLKDIKADGNIGKVVLDLSEHSLEGVTISGRKRIIEHKADRTIFNVENSTTANGSDAFELLKRTPGLQVQGSDIRMTGKSTVTVLLNDKLIRLSGDELEAMLHTISSDQVTRIEVITTPPARYDAAGNAGMVQIVTKKYLNEGYNAQLTAAYQQRFYSSYVSSGSFNYRKGIVNVYGNLNLNSFRFFSPQETITLYPDQQQDQHNSQDNHPLYGRNELGLDLALGKRSVIGMLYTLGFTNRYMDQDFLTNVSSGGKTDSFLHTQAYTAEHALRNAANLNYEWKIDTSGRKFNAELEYFTRPDEQSRDFSTRNYYRDGSTTSFRTDNKTTGVQHIDIMTARADLVLPGHFATWSMGAKVSSVHNNADNRFYSLAGSDYLNDTGRSNHFDYKEHTQAAYISAQRQRNKWDMQLGLRVENTETKGTLLNTGQTHINNYCKLFPSFYLQYNAAEDLSWTIRYSRRISRANFNDLNPFRNYTTATAYESGNAFLQPSFSHNAELSCSFLSDYTITVFAERLEQCQVRVSQIDSVNNTYSFTLANAGKGFNFGITGSIAKKMLPFWELNADLNLYNAAFSAVWNGHSYGKLNTNVCAININNSFTCNRSKTLFAELGFNYNSEEQNDFTTRQYAYSTLSAGFRALAGHKRWIISMRINDMLKQGYDKLINTYNGTRENNYFDQRSCIISVSRKFGSDKIKKRIRDAGNDEINRAN